MNIKTFLFTCVFFVLYSFATNPTWTTPSKVHVSAFAVNDYSYYLPNTLRSLQRTIHHKNFFIDSLFAEVSVHYPGKSTYVPYDYEDTSATFLNYKSAFTYNTEFVFFSGHGGPQKICLYKFDC